uniref:Integral membrane protein 2 n=1 Tax=Monopterus albus TaxID=43700 RepID=A0A3Q3QS00_MONAL
MVKVSFNSALAQKDVKKDSETLIPTEDKDAEADVLVHRQSRAWCWCMCLGLALMLSGVVVGGGYLYRHYILEQPHQAVMFIKLQEAKNGQVEKFIATGVESVVCPEEKPREHLPLVTKGQEVEQEGQVFVCGVDYREEDFMIREEEEMEVELPNQFQLRQLEERIRVLEKEQVELISVPVPEFEDGDPADIVHDFQRRLTAYLDLNLNKCYVIPLNTSIVMPPRDFLELLINVKAGTYLPQSYLVHEEMIVTERLEHVEQLGYFIYNLCQGKDTYKLQRRDRILGMQKREALNCHKILHFASKSVVQTLICDP